jgi:hypothetical protein
MACFVEWTAAVGGVLTAGAGGAGIVASGIIEAGSVGTLTPVAAATLYGSVLTLLAGLAACLGAGYALAKCYDENGNPEAAEKVRQRVSALQSEYDRLTAFADRLKAIAA